MVRYLPVIIILVLFIYGLIDCVRSDANEVRSISKTAWVVAIIFLPLVGVLLWFFLGRPRYLPEPTGQVRLPLAPDDDPEFLRNLELSRRHKVEDERLRKLKAESDARKARLRDQHPDDGQQHGGKNRQDNPDAKP
ncbi:MAG: PLD nuclease N-terminal domain-containing protein [Actinomycetota bacterium]|nr:PLD nuclease N-terminal domain-containing protein [Actinomycetota bacterium]